MAGVVEIEGAHDSCQLDHRTTMEGNIAQNKRQSQSGHDNDKRTTVSIYFIKSVCGHLKAF
jgi:hypothetical protein